ncbi:MAG: glycosyltransferase family 4 protein [Desulfobacterales bacterium]|nr:glycosyltransferase family 4 protein [Desulfobacterales bacterium]
MKVGVYLGYKEQELGGGFTLQDDIFQALVRLESGHTFVIFSNTAKAQTKALTPSQFQSVSLQRGFIERARLELSKVAAAAAVKVPTIWSFVGLPLVGYSLWRGHRHRRWLRKTVRDLEIQLMWFVTSNYVEVDIPYVFTVLDLQHRLQPWFPEVSAKGLWRRREEHYATAMRRASAVITGTESGKAEIVQFYQVPPERIKLIPHPTPRFALDAPKENNKEMLTKYHIPEGYLFYPAQFWPHKNHVTLLLAVRILREKHDLILPVVFAGSDGGNLQHVRRVVDELGLSTQVYFLGFVPRQDLVGLYRNALVLTYLTFFGPENLPPVEAFALGCPVIASNVPGALEQLGDAALLVDPKDEEQIAGAIKRLHDDPALRDTLVSRGLSRASKWTAEEFVKSVFSLIDEFEPVRRCWH